MSRPPRFEAEIHALMNAGAGRARIQVIQQASEKLKVALAQAGFDIHGDVDANSGLGKFAELAEGWRKEAERLGQLEQPALEDVARRAAMSIAAPRSPLDKLRRAWRAALAELR